jgi:hypothetical protein
VTEAMDPIEGFAAVKVQIGTVVKNAERFEVLATFARRPMPSTSGSTSARQARRFLSIRGTGPACS